MQEKSVFLPENNIEIQDTFRIYEQKAYEDSILKKSKQKSNAN